MANTPLISIIVPVYNVERYLPRCIESILRQTYTNFELILVDDGTPDRSGIICDRYAEKDSRIRVIHKENGGVSSARNAGIDAAKGEWLTFVDSDDWISNDYLLTLTNLITEDDFDLVVGGVESRSINVSSNKRDDISISIRNINDHKNLEEIYLWEFWGPCVKLFSTNKIIENRIKFPDGIAMGEDDIFVNRYLKYCEKIHITFNTIYFYNRLNEKSVTRNLSYFSERNKWDEVYMDSFIEVFKAWSVNEDFSLNMISRRAGERFHQNVNSIISSLPKQEAKEKIYAILPSYEKWFVLDCKWSQKRENYIRRDLVTFIKKSDIEGIYNLLSVKKQKNIKITAKNILKKVIGPFLEKYRDGCIKYRF